MGFVLGVAFATVVTSLVEDVITPVIGTICGQPDFDTLAIDAGDSVISYGPSLNAVLSFLLVALALFMFVVKPYNAFKARFSAPEEESAAGPSEDIVLLTEIRDALRR